MFFTLSPLTSSWPPGNSTSVAFSTSEFVFSSHYFTYFLVCAPVLMVRHQKCGWIFLPKTPFLPPAFFSPILPYPLRISSWIRWQAFDTFPFLWLINSPIFPLNVRKARLATSASFCSLLAQKLNRKSAGVLVFPYPYTTTKNKIKINQHFTNEVKTLHSGNLKK